MDNDDYKNLHSLFHSKLSVNKSGIAKGLSFGDINALEDQEIQANLINIISRQGDKGNQDGIKEMLNMLRRTRSDYARQGNHGGTRELGNMITQIESMNPAIERITSTFSKLGAASDQVQRIFTNLSTTSKDNLAGFNQSLDVVTAKMHKDIAGGMSEGTAHKEALRRTEELAVLANAKTLGEERKFDEFAKIYNDPKYRKLIDEEAEFKGSDTEKAYIHHANRKNERWWRNTVTPVGNAALGAMGNMMAGGGVPLANQALESIQKGVDTGMRTYGALASGQNVTGAGAGRAMRNTALAGLAAFGGWELGRYISESTGLDDTLPERMVPSLLMAAKPFGLGMTREEAEEVIANTSGPDNPFAATAEAEESAESLAKSFNDAKDSVDAFGLGLGAVGATSVAAMAKKGINPFAAAGAAATGAITFGLDLYGKAVQQGTQLADGYYNSAALLSSDVYKGITGGVNHIGEFAAGLSDNKLTHLGFSALEVSQGMTVAGRGTMMDSTSEYSELVTGSGMVGRKLGVMLDEMVEGVTNYMAAGGTGGAAGFMGTINALGRDENGKTNAFSKQLTDSFVAASRQLAMTSTSSNFDDIAGMFGMTRDALRESDNSYISNLAKFTPEITENAVRGLDSFMRSGLSGDNGFATGLMLRSGFDYWDMSQGLQNSSNMSRLIGTLASETGMGRYLEGGNINRAGMNMVGMLSSQLGVDSGVLKELFEAHYSGGLNTQRAKEIMEAGTLPEDGEVTRDTDIDDLRRQRIITETALIDTIKDAIPTVTALNFAFAALALTSVEMMGKLTSPARDAIVNLLPKSVREEFFEYFLGEKTGSDSPKSYDQIRVAPEREEPQSASVRIGNMASANLARIPGNEGMIAVLLNENASIIEVRRESSTPEDTETGG